MAVRAAIVSYMVDIAYFLIGRHIGPYTSVQEYVRATKMATWGTEVKTITLSHLLNTPVLSYVTEHANWNRSNHRAVDMSLDDDYQTEMSIYLRYNGVHFEVVCSTRK